MIVIYLWDWDSFTVACISLILVKISQIVCIRPYVFYKIAVCNFMAQRCSVSYVEMFSVWLLVLCSTCYMLKTVSDLTS